jgi:hypothetical protein
MQRPRNPGKFSNRSFQFLACAIAAILCASLTHAAQDNAPPVVIIPTDVMNAVIGEPVTLSIEVDSTHPLRYCWRKDGEILPDETGSKLKIQHVVPSAAGAYTVEASNEHGTTISEPMIVRVCAPSPRIYRHNHGIKLTFKARKCVRYTIECKNLLSHEVAWNHFATIENKNGTVRLTDHAAPSHSLCVFRLKAESAYNCPEPHHDEEDDQHDDHDE